MEDSSFKDASSEEQAFSYEKMLDIIIVKGWIILTIALIVLVASIFHYYKKPDIYRAVCKLIIVKASRESVVAQKEVEEIKDGGRGYWDAKIKNTYLVLLTCSEMLLKLSQHLNLKEKLGMNSDEETAAFLKGIIKPFTYQNNDVINISVEYKDPVLCRDLANGLADVFMEDFVNERLYLAQQFLKWFPEQIVDGKISSDKAADKNIDPLSNREILNLLPTATENIVIRDLKDKRVAVQLDLDKLSKAYKDKHPEIIKLKSQLSNINEQIDKELDIILRSIKSQLSGVFQINTVRIIEYANIPGLPIGPQRNRSILLNAILSVLLSLSGIIFLDTVNTKVFTEFEIMEYTSLPFLGYVPKIKKHISSSGFLEVLDHAADDTLSDAFAYIRTSVSFSAPKEKSSLFLVTSVTPGEGKSFLSVQLSLAFSKNNEKTLIIDGDFRQPVIHKSMNARKEPGLSDYIVKDLNPEDVIREIKDKPNLFFISSGHTTPNPSELLSSDRFKSLIGIFKKEFDRIIIDSPPLLDMPDSYVLSSIVDGVILVLRSGRIDRRILMRTITKMKQTNTNIIGVVINDFVPQKYGPYYYRYYRKRYYKSYYAKSTKSSRQV